MQHVSQYNLSHVTWKEDRHCQVILLAQEIQKSQPVSNLIRILSPKHFPKSDLMTKVQNLRITSWFGQDLFNTSRIFLKLFGHVIRVNNFSIAFLLLGKRRGQRGNKFG